MGTDTTSQQQKHEIESVLSEARVFPPPPEFSKRAHIKSMDEYRRIYDEALKNPDRFWGAKGREELYWKVPFQTVREWKPPHAKWFIEGKTNLAYNCLDRHLPRLKDKVALLWEGEPGEVRRITSAGAGESSGQRAAKPGRKKGRSGGNLPADGARGGGRHARLRPDWRHPLAGVRRLLRGGGARADE